MLLTEDQSLPRDDWQFKCRGGSPPGVEKRSSIIEIVHRNGTYPKQDKENRTH